MSFKSRYLGEATEQTITNNITGATDFAAKAADNAANAIAKPVSQGAKIATISPQQSIIRTSEVTDDLNRTSSGNPKPNPTANDASKVERTLNAETVRDTKLNSRTPFNAQITEAENIVMGVNIDARIPGKFDNNLTKKLNDVGINIGVSKSDVSASDNAVKTGEKNITTGTKASFGLGRSDAKRQAKDGLKTAQDVPGADDIKSSTMTLSDSAYLKIGYLIEEYTNQDVENAAKGPVKHSSVPKGQGVQPGVHTAQTQRMVSQVNDVSDDKMKARGSIRNATMPEVNQDYAAEHTTGLKTNQYAQKYSTDALNAQTRTAKEERKSAEAEAQQSQGQ